MMKLFKFFTAGALMLGAMTVANAQEDASNSDSMAISWGVKGGVNFANLNGDDFGDADSRTSFHVGALVEFPLAEIFSLQVEALYSGQGAARSYTVSNPLDPEFGERKDAELQLDYINVPVLAKVYLFKGFSLEAGPQFSFLVNDEYDTDPTGNNGDSPSPYRDSLNTFEFGAVGGLSFTTEMGLFAYARYNQGISDIADDVKVNNSVFQLGLGYKF
ncbi:MAG: porin family protein [Flavobacterium sp.]